MVLTTRLLVLLVALVAPSAAFSWWSHLKINCGVSLWSEWIQNADGRTRTRTRDVYRAPQNGGTLCPALAETETNPWNPCTPSEMAYTIHDSFLSPKVVKVGRHRRQTPTIKPRDILFIVDMSGSITKAGFKQALKNIAVLVGEICGSVGSGDRMNRVAAVSFSSDARTNFNFGKYSTLNEVQRAIQDMVYEGGDTCLEKGLEEALDVFEMDTGMRGDDKSVKEVVILTDGKWNCADDSKIFNLVRKLRDVSTQLDQYAREIAIYAFVIGNAKEARYQRKVESLISLPLTEHLFVLANMITFNKTVEAIQSYSNNNPTRCAPFEL